MNADFVRRYGPCALILGGSEGIGAAFAQQLAAAGLDLILVARSAGPLNATANAVRIAHPVKVTTAQIDLATSGAADQVAALVDAQEIGLVIYNAGATHGAGFFLDEPEAKGMTLVYLNCVTPVALLHRVLAPMRARRRGGAILLSSMSAMAGSGLVAVYAATKAFMLTLAEGLHWELKRDGVDVLCAVAGLTATPAMARSGILAVNNSGFAAKDPDELAREVLASLGKRPVWYAVGSVIAAVMHILPRQSISQKLTMGAAALYKIKV